MAVCVLGSINVDLVHRVDHLPAPGETLIAGEGVRHPGGKGANQAIAAARLGARVEMIGAVGADADGDFMLERLQAAGVEAGRVKRRPDLATGRAFIAVDPAGENMIFVSSGANAAVGYDGGGEGCGVFLAQLETPIDATRALFQTPAAVEATRVLNAAPASAEALDLLPLCDVIVVNQTELAFYAARPTSGRELDAEAARRLISRPGQTVVVTLGAAGAAAVTSGEVILIAGRRVESVDATGAGDCFCGALAAALDAGQALHDALALANRAAALSTTRMGAASSMPTRAELEAADLDRRATGG